jgi:hypothetical protein
MNMDFLKTDMVQLINMSNLPHQKDFNAL